MSEIRPVLFDTASDIGEKIEAEMIQLGAGMGRFQQKRTVTPVFIDYSRDCKKLERYEGLGSGFGPTMKPEIFFDVGFVALSSRGIGIEGGITIPTVAPSLNYMNSPSGIARGKHSLDIRDEEVGSLKRVLIGESDVTDVAWDFLEYYLKTTPGARSCDVISSAGEVLKTHVSETRARIEPQYRII